MHKGGLKPHSFNFIPANIITWKSTWQIKAPLPLRHDARCHARSRARGEITVQGSQARRNIQCKRRLKTKQQKKFSEMQHKTRDKKRCNTQYKKPRHARRESQRNAQGATHGENMTVTKCGAICNKRRVEKRGILQNERSGTIRSTGRRTRSSTRRGDKK